MGLLEVGILGRSSSGGRQMSLFFFTGMIWFAALCVNDVKVALATLTTGEPQHRYPSNG